MQVIGDRLNTTVGKWMVLLRGTSLAVHAWHNVPQMSDHGVCCKEVTVLVEVRAPRIDHAFGHNLKAVVNRMESPDTASDPRSTVARCAGLADVRGS